MYIPALNWCLILKVFGMTETGVEDYLILRQRSFQIYLSELSVLLGGGWGGWEDFPNLESNTQNQRKRSGYRSSRSSQLVLTRSWLRPTQEHVRLVWQRGNGKFLGLTNVWGVSIGCCYDYTTVFQALIGEAPMQAPASQIRRSKQKVWMQVWEKKKKINKSEE